MIDYLQGYFNNFFSFHFCYFHIFWGKHIHSIVQFGSGNLRFMLSFFIYLQVKKERKSLLKLSSENLKSSLGIDSLVQFSLLIEVVQFY